MFALTTILGDGRCGFMDGHMGAGWWWVMGIGWLVFLVLVAVVLLAFARRPHPGAGGPSASNAEDLLAARFARGEIDEDEYRRRRSALRDG